MALMAVEEQTTAHRGKQGITLNASETAAETTYTETDTRMRTKKILLSLVHQTIIIVFKK